MEKIVYTENNKYGLIDITEAIYDEINHFLTNVLILKKDNKYGLFDIHNKQFVLPVEYQDITIKNDYIVANKEKKTIVLDFNLKLLRCLTFDNIYVPQSNC